MNNQISIAYLFHYKNQRNFLYLIFLFFFQIITHNFTNKTSAKKNSLRLKKPFIRFIKYIIYFFDGIFPIYQIKLRNQKYKFNLLKSNYDKTTERFSKINSELEILYKSTKKKAEDVRASIEYAKTIQNTILPLESTLNQYFKIFISYQPKDIISGDFYWISKNLSSSKNQYKIIFILADCTGHGVPGALLSLIGERIINEIVHINHIYNPSDILHAIDNNIKTTLQQNHTYNKDGMDAGICLIEKNDDTNFHITYSGAKHNLIYHTQNDNQVKIIRGEYFSIGGMFRDIEIKKKYTLHHINLNKGDRFFLYTDGFTDQFNKSGKKFGKGKLLEVLENNMNQPIDVLHKIIEFEWKLHKQFEIQIDDSTITGIELL